MELTKALEVLNAATGQYKGNRDEHIAIQEALTAVQNGINRLQFLEEEQKTKPDETDGTDAQDDTQEASSDGQSDPSSGKEQKDDSSQEDSTDDAKTD